MEIPMASLARAGISCAGKDTRCDVKNAARLLVVFVCLSVVSLPAMADLISSCAADFSTCSVYENSLVTFPGDAISGDVILLEPDATVSDVFRIFNNIVDTGSGTGLGLTGFLYSFDDGNLPSPVTYSANAVFITESQISVNGLTETDYNGNGVMYKLFSAPASAPVPEPSSWALLGMVIAGAGCRECKRLIEQIHRARGPSKWAVSRRTG